MTGFKLVTVLAVAILVITQLQSEATSNMPTIIQSVVSEYTIADKLSVFKQGNFTTKAIKLQTQDSSAPPVPMLIATPNTTEGYYPVLFFIHGFGFNDYNYHDIIHHIASHGIVVVSPEISMYIQQPEEIEISVSAVNWLPKKLKCVLPENVEADFNRVAISGHGRGGKTAFALALGKSNTALKIKIAALVGIDPVAGYNKNYRTEPHILTYKPKSFNLSIPTTIIGTELGNHSLIPYITQPCAPNDVSHNEFYKECSKKCSHFVIADCGYSDMLNRLNPIPIVGTNCASGNGPKDVVRRTVAGIVVSFLNAYFQDEVIEYVAILNNPSFAPTRLSVVENTGDMPDI